ARAVSTWPMSSHQPANTNQMTLPMAPTAPPRPLSTASRPQGQIANPAIRKDASPQGTDAPQMQAMIPAPTYPRDSDQPAVSSQMMFRISEMSVCMPPP